jgi:hypothetical protein
MMRVSQRLHGLGALSYHGMVIATTVMVAVLVTVLLERAERG